MLGQLSSFREGKKKRSQVCPLGAISIDANIPIEITRRISAASARLRKYSSQLNDQPNAQLPLEIRLLKQSWWKLCCTDVPHGSSSLEDSEGSRAAHHKLSLRVLGFRRKQSGYKTLSYRDLLEMTNRERVKMIIRKHQLWFAEGGGGALVWQDTSRLPMGTAFGRLDAQGAQGDLSVLQTLGEPPQTKTSVH